MGGSGSTGSSLLKNILGRHPDIFASQETSLFAKKELYENWSMAKGNIFKSQWFGLKNYSFHRYAKIDFYPVESHITFETALQLIRASSSFQAFANSYFGMAARQNDANIWVEKTPANACLFQHFDHAFNNSLLIHVIRHPLDTIASLVSRGFDPYYAACVYLIHTASALACRQKTNYVEVGYENLVQTPAETVASLCSRIHINFDPIMLNPHQEEQIDVTKLEGWQYNETEAIGTKSVDRFFTLHQSLQDDIWMAIQSIQINKKGQEIYQTQHTTILEISEILGYRLKHDSIKRSKKNKLKKFKWQDQFIRMKYNYPYALRNYPISII